MLENRIAVGDYIYGCDFPSAVDGGGPGMSNEGVEDVEITVRTVHTERYGLFWAYKRETGVDEVKVSFRWLPWVDGKINYCQAQGNDVLTGPFSGCWMAAYTEGSVKVCHITLQPDDRDCKATWRTQKALNGVSNVSEFLPHKAVSEGLIRLGLVTSNGAMYAIGMDKVDYQVANPFTADQWKEHLADFTGMDIDDATAREIAARPKVSFSNFHRGEVYRICQIKGPIAAQVFPA